MKRVLTFAVSSLAALALSTGTALAHVSAAPSTTGAGEYSYVRFGVGHGCDDSGTTSVTFQIPQDKWVFTSVTPYENPQWKISVKTGKLKEATDNHGETMTEGISEVTYTRVGPALATDRGDALHMSIRLPEDAAGETIHIPTVQRCEQGQNPWVEIPAEGESADELEYPAPSITVTEGSGGHGGGGDAGDDDAGGEHDDGDDAGDEEREAADEADDARTLAVVALLVGAVSLLVGLLALMKARRHSHDADAR